MVQQTSALDNQASAAVSGLLSGQGVDIHQAMIATQKANMAFELALQVRNKAVGAYQQMMGMQF
jgi:flagellar hook-basal body complex protein FliE